MAGHSPKAQHRIQQCKTDDEWFWNSAGRPVQPRQYEILALRGIAAGRLLGMAAPNKANRENAG